MTGLRLAVILVLPTMLSAQATPAKPSATIPAFPPTQSTNAPLPPPPHHAIVTFQDGKLNVAADNSSLNQILREISRETGMKITGGVTDERVFGHYGPSAPDVVLADLLDGTAANIMLVHGQNSIPAELILTPRTGGPTPPNPNAAIAQEREQQTMPAYGVPPAPRNEAIQFPVNNPTSQQGANPPAAPSSDSTTDQQSPNGVKTPQQIFDQLQKLRQQQQTTTTPQ